MKLAKPAWLRSAEARLRPIDLLPRNVAAGAGLAVGAGAGALAGWTGAPWAYGVAAGTLAAAGWLASSAEAVSVLVPSKPVPLPVPPKPRLSLALGMKALPSGVFWMGAAQDDPQRFRDESPRHQVSVAAFEVAKYQVRQSVYEAVMGDNPSDPKGADLPVNQVSWFDAITFCNELSLSEDLRPAYRVSGSKKQPSVERDRSADGFRLPSEAEWEYAARAGTETAWSFGDDDERLGEHAWWSQNSDNKPHPVGTKAPNPWGLFDVHGNVLEWCWDVYGPYGEPLPTGGERVVRGGSFSYRYPRDFRSARRAWYPPEFRYDFVGFRCVRGGSRQP